MTAFFFSLFLFFPFFSLLFPPVLVLFSLPLLLLHSYPAMPTENPPDLLQTAAAGAAAKGKNIHDVVGASVSLSSLPAGVVDDDDDELSDETIGRLLREAEERMKASSAALSTPFSGVNKISMTKYASFSFPNPHPFFKKIKFGVCAPQACSISSFPLNKPPTKSSGLIRVPALVSPNSTPALLWQTHPSNPRVQFLEYQILLC